METVSVVYKHRHTSLNFDPQFSKQISTSCAVLIASNASVTCWSQHATNWPPISNCRMTGSQVNYEKRYSYDFVHRLQNQSQVIGDNEIHRATANEA